jgi:hypothetical protein
MATMVRGEKGQWWVVDSLFDHPLPHGEWMKRAARFDDRKDAPRVRFYVTDARKFQPAFGRYRARDFGIPELKPYFTELFRSLTSTR